MIKLVFEDVEISIKEDNPVYKTLKRFEGESFTVRIASTESVTDKETPKQLKSFTVEAEPYYNLLSESFSKEFLKTPTGTLLRSHLDNIFTSKLKTMAKVGVDREKNIIYITPDGAFALVGL